MAKSNEALEQGCALTAPNEFAHQQQLHDKLDTLMLDQPNSGVYSNSSYHQLDNITDTQYEMPMRQMTLGSTANSEFYSSFEDDYNEAPNDLIYAPSNLRSSEAQAPLEQHYWSTYNEAVLYNEPQQQAVEDEPWVEIIEQPDPWAPKFRYMNERHQRFPGAITGKKSSSDKKTYPSIRINNIRGPARVVVSCVTAEEPYRVHPHSLLSRHKENCSNGIYTVHLDESLIDSTTSSITQEFDSLGIECAKRRDVEESLRMREEIKVDPFLLGYEHKNDLSSIDLNVIRLCFQVFIEGTEAGVFDRPLAPCVTEPIHNKKNQSKLNIMRVSHPSVEASGGTEIILLTEKIDPKDILVRFYEEQESQIVWESTVDITNDNVHERSAIFFSTPRYREGYITGNVTASMQLVRKSDGQASEPRNIMFIGCRSDNQFIDHKKRKLDAFLNAHPAPQVFQRQEAIYQAAEPPGPRLYYGNDPFLAGPSQYDY